jgi:phosphotransferase system HPr-like phosphotransfer protein
MTQSIQVTVQQKVGQKYQRQPYVTNTSDIKIISLGSLVLLQIKKKSAVTVRLPGNNAAYLAPTFSH